MKNFLRDAFIVVFCLTTGFLVGAISEDFKRADERATTLNMIKGS